MKPKTDRRRFYLDRKHRLALRGMPYLAWARRNERRAERRMARYDIASGLEEAMMSESSPNLVGLVLFLALAKKAKAEKMAATQRYFSSFWGGHEPNWEDMLFLAEEELGLADLAA